MSFSNYLKWTSPNNLGITSETEENEYPSSVIAKFKMAALNHYAILVKVQSVKSYEMDYRISFDRSGDLLCLLAGSNFFVNRKK